MIKYKTWFHGWQEVDKQTALKLARHLFRGAVAMKAEKRIEYLNTRFKGISFTEAEL